VKILFVVKRHTSNQDILTTAFGRYHHLPTQLHHLGHEVAVIAINQYGGNCTSIQRDGVRFHSSPWYRARSILRHYPFSPDLIIAGGHLYCATVGAWLAKSIHVPIIYDLYDFYPAFTGIAQPMAQVWFNRQIHSADAVTVASDALGQYCKPFNSNLQVVRNAANEMVFKKDDAAKARARLQLPMNARLIGYPGGATAYTMLNAVAACIQKLPNPTQPIHLVHMGPPSKELIRNKDVICLGNRSEQDVAALINACDIMLAPYRNVTQVKFSNACKLSEYAACQAVVAASRNGDWSYYFPNDYQGLFDPDDLGSLATAISAQLTSGESMQIKAEVTWEFQANQLSLFLRNLPLRRP
jgi:glycosyltransferase involved in cell wall biosynthesis